jgi:hypothetical protein
VLFYTQSQRDDSTGACRSVSGDMKNSYSAGSLPGAHYEIKEVLDWYLVSELLFDCAKDDQFDDPSHTSTRTMSIQALVL